jgi:hypothetical protein
VRALPGAEDLYIADDTIFTGPPYWGEQTEIDAHHDIPRIVLESPEGVGFLAAISAPLPPTLAARVVEHKKLVHIAVRATRNLTTAESEHLVADVIASDPASGRTETLGRDAWTVTVPGTEPEGWIVRYDRSLLPAACSTRSALPSILRSVPSAPA